MMRAEDLRRGNKILYNGFESVVLGITNDGDAYVRYHKTPLSIIECSALFGWDGNTIEGIPLTEDWLLKFGFIMHITPPLPTAFIESKLYSLNGLALSTSQIMHWRWHGGYAITDIDYVHQLQNLYFALTNTELTIKE